jgi:hypothetical protein
MKGRVTMKVFEVIVSRQYVYSIASFYGLIVDESEEQARDRFLQSKKGKEFAGDDLDESEKWRINFYIRKVDLSFPGVYELYST